MSLFGGNLVFTFASPIQEFGAYLIASGSDMRFASAASVSETSTLTLFGSIFLAAIVWQTQRHRRLPH